MVTMYISKKGEIGDYFYWEREARIFYGCVQFDSFLDKKYHAGNISNVPLPINWFDRWTRTLGLEVLHNESI